MTKTAVATEEPRKKIYVAGPMRGVPQFNFPAFINAAKVLRAKGYEVFSPAERDLHAGFDYRDTTGSDEDMRRQNFSLREALGDDLEWISQHADAVALLPGWERSTGANAEVATAKALGLAVYLFENDELIDITDNVFGLFASGVLPSSKPANVTFVNGTSAATSSNITLSRNPADYFVTTTTASTSSGEVRTTSSKGGQKGVKLARYDLVPAVPLRILAEHYGRGASKYADHQWMKGYEWSKSFAALQRHAWQFWNGQDYDTDEGPLKGSPHMAAVAWHAFALLQYMQDNRDLDDRPTTKVNVSVSTERKDG